MNCQQVLNNIYVFLSANILYIFTDFSWHGHSAVSFTILSAPSGRIKWEKQG